MATKKKGTRKKAAAKKSPAKKTPAKKKVAAKKAPARKAPAKKAARKAPAKKAAARRRTTREQPQHVTLYDDRFEPEKVRVRWGQWVYLTSGRDDRNVPVHVPDCFGVTGERSLKKRGAVLKLKVIKNVQVGPYPIKAPRKTGPNTDIKGEIEVVSKD